MDAEDRDGAVEEGEDFEQLIDALRDGSRATPAGDPDAADLNPEEMDRLDLDGDGEIAPWEIERARRRLERAELHPVKNDLGDGEYPIEREEYGRSEEEFDAADSNGDDQIDVEEYYEFLVDVDRVTLELDVDGDRGISEVESGLSSDDFAPLDRDDSGDLKRWEILRAIALGIWD